jgi:hypothetical protein
MIVSSIGGVAMSSIYNAGLGFFLGLPYMVLTGLVTVAVVLFV